jgi:hypothetical protein
MAENSFTDFSIDDSFTGNPDDLEFVFSDKSPEDVEKERKEKEEAKKKQADLDAEEAKKKQTPVSVNKLIDNITDDENVDDEDEEKKDDKKEEKKEGEEDKQEEPKGFDAEALAKDLFQLGILTEDEEDAGKSFKTQEELLERFNKEKQKGAVEWLENFLSQHGDDRKELFDAIFLSGVDPKEYLPIANSIENFKDLDIADEANQKLVYREFYKRAGLSEATIEKKLQRDIDNGDLKDEAESLHPQLVAQDSKKAQEMVQKTERDKAVRAQALEQQRASVANVLREKIKEKEINGFPINEQSAKKVFDMITNQKWKTPSGELISDLDKMILDTKRPENAATRVLLGLLFESNFDLSRIEKKAISKETNSLFNSLTEKTKKTNVQKQPEKKASIWDKI